MRRRMPRLAVTSTALAAVVLLVGGCEAQVRGEPAPPQSSATAPPASLPAAPQSPPSPTSAPFDGLEARIRQATADAAQSGARIQAVVMDRRTGQIVSNGATAPFPIASVVKLFIADDLLLRVSKGETTLSPADRASLDLMLRSSDDSAAQMFWDRSGGTDIIARVKARYGLPGTTAPWNGRWDVTTSTASDLARYYNMLLDGSGGLPRAQANIIMSDLAASTPTGTDGYPQRFGIPDGLYDEQVAVKQGWFCCWDGANQLHVSTGAIGPERRYVMALSSLEPDDEAAARETMTQAVKTMFPNGRI